MLSNSPLVTFVPVQDLERATKFYTEMLGLKHVGGNPGQASIFEAGDGTRLTAYMRAPTKADHTVATFYVDDIEGVVKALTGKGVKFEQYDSGPIKTNEIGIASLGPLKSAWFKDTEGNIFGISTRPPS